MPLRFNRRFTAGLFRVNVTRSGVSGSIGRRVIRFERIVVMPDGHKYIEGQTPKQLPAPASQALPDASHALPSEEDPDKGPININDS
jgi:hypothetical protein